ncbi:MAG: hypothetical protein IPG88_24270 [Gemmatimonadetes bacterium]|nr:hypothetical protein [Gemmatimonadota bacterium]
MDTTAIAPTLAQEAPHRGSGGAPRRHAPAEGYRLAHAGSRGHRGRISQQFVALALAELGGAQRGGAAGTALSPAPIGGWRERRATQASAPRSRAAQPRVSSRPHHHASSRRSARCCSRPSSWCWADGRGTPARRRGLVFDLPGAVSRLGVASGLNLTWYGDAIAAGAGSLQVTLREAPGIPGSTEVTMYTDLRPGVRRNVNASAWLSGTLGATGGGLAAAIGAKALVALGALGIALPAVGAGAVIAAGTMALYRSSYRGAVRRAEGRDGTRLDAVAGACGPSSCSVRPLRRSARSASEDFAAPTDGVPPPRAAALRLQPANRPSRSRTTLHFSAG